MNWKRVISGVLAAAMLSALPVQLLASAEGAEAAAEVNTWEDLTSVESLEDSNTFYYNKNGYTFEKLTAGFEEHPQWKELLEQTDILIDGPFVLEQKSLMLHFRGSKNQRVIDPKESLKQGTVVERDI